MYYDGVAIHLGYGIGVLFISPHGDQILRSVRLAFFDCYFAMNNIVKYWIKTTWILWKKNDFHKTTLSREVLL